MLFIYLHDIYGKSENLCVCQSDIRERFSFFFAPLRAYVIFRCRFTVSFSLSVCHGTHKTHGNRTAQQHTRKPSDTTMAHKLCMHTSMAYSHSHSRILCGNCHTDTTPENKSLNGVSSIGICKFLIYFFFLCFHKYKRTHRDVHVDVYTINKCIATSCLIFSFFSVDSILFSLLLSLSLSLSAIVCWFLLVCSACLAQKCNRYCLLLGRKYQ